MSVTAQEINKSTDRLNKIIKKREIFDPRIIDENDNSKQLWNTESVELALKGLSEGYKLKDNPYLKSVRGALLRKANLAFKYTEDEIKCIEYCAEDKIFFSNNFAKLKDGGKGWSNIVLRDYQENLLHQYTKNRWNILMFPRQSGKTTTTVIEIVHFCCFNVDKDCVVIAQSDKVVNEILSKIKECFAALPFFMQPGFVSFNKKGFVLDNGCRLSIGVASESVVQGFSLDLVFIDEFAYIRDSVAKKFWDNIYPTLVNNQESRCIIASTPNGRNLFWKLWNGAQQKTNKFVPYRIYWYDVPGRDQQFKYDTIANVGIDGWLMGFECSFDVGLKSVFATPKQQELRHIQTLYEKDWKYENDPIGAEYGIYFLNKEKYSYNLRKDWFLLSVDLGEGLEQDFSVLKIKKIDWNIELKRLEYKTVGVYHSNEISVEDFAEMNLDLFKHFDKNKIKVVVENNTYGGEYFLQIDNQVMNNPSQYTYYSPDIFAKFRRESKNDYERGIRWNQYNKKTAVKSFSNLVTKDIMQETYYQTIEEYLNFGKQKNGTYAASYGHDDLTMADVTAAFFIKCGDIFSNQWLNIVESDLRLLYNDERLEIKLKKAEEERKKRNRYEHNGFHLRDHKECVEKIENQNSDVYLFLVE
jgi:hypothetical protein